MSTINLKFVFLLDVFLHIFWREYLVCNYITTKYYLRLNDRVRWGHLRKLLVLILLIYLLFLAHFVQQVQLVHSHLWYQTKFVLQVITYYFDSKIILCWNDQSNDAHILRANVMCKLKIWLQPLYIKLSTKTVFSGLWSMNQKCTNWFFNENTVINIVEVY